MTILTLILFFFALTIHEFSHGWVAWKLGDPTAKNAGRLTLNPLAHIDPIGTIFLPLMLIMTHSPFIFGWAKPVPVDFYNLRNPKRDMVWVGLAGPMANIALAIVLSFFLKILVLTGDNPLSAILSYAIMINLLLAVFNALPIPPLDGSRVLIGLLPRKLAMQYSRIEPYGFIIIIGFLWLGMIGSVIWPIVMRLARLLGVTI